jgi:hypothetical protein
MRTQSSRWIWWQLTWLLSSFPIFCNNSVVLTKILKHLFCYIVTLVEETYSHVKYKLFYKVLLLCLGHQSFLWFEIIIFFVVGSFSRWIFLFSLEILIQFI